MERRLLVARELLNPKKSALVVTIDEKEFLRLGLLLEQLFPEANVQMVTTAINATGAIRVNEFTRVNEYIFFVLFDSMKIAPEPTTDANSEVPWNLLQRREMPSRRGGPQPGPDQFYPIYVGLADGRIREIGDPIPLGVPRSTALSLPGCVAVFPLKLDGTEMNWGLTPQSLRKILAEGFVKVVRNRKQGSQGFSIYYLTSGKAEAIRNGEAEVTRRNDDGSVIATYKAGQASMPSTIWNRESHNAQSHGTKLLSKFLPGRKFPFPKALFAVEDALRYFTRDNPNAIILDFFAGSGTTAHAVMRLNRQDGGRRQCISVTNNEVAADEQAALCRAGLRPGHPDWEKWGICDYITKPRIAAAIAGKTPEGRDIEGDYKFTDEFPMAEGFEANAEFFTLTYESHVAVGANVAFQRIAPLLWMRAGSEGRRIDDLPEGGWALADTYGLLVDLDRAGAFCDAVAAQGGLSVAYVVTDDDRRFQAVARALPEGVEPVRLYESYLSNFRFSMGR